MPRDADDCTVTLPVCSTFSPPCALRFLPYLRPRSVKSRLVLADRVWSFMRSGVSRNAVRSVQAKGRFWVSHLNVHWCAPPVRGNNFHTRSATILVTRAICPTVAPPLAGQRSADCRCSSRRCRQWRAPAFVSQSPEKAPSVLTAFALQLHPRAEAPD